MAPYFSSIRTGLVSEVLYELQRVNSLALVLRSLYSSFNTVARVLIYLVTMWPRSQELNGSALQYESQSAQSKRGWCPEEMNTPLFTSEIGRPFWHEHG